ncbi:MAG: hypothetical protein WC683_19315 [bacterium]
MKKNRKDEKKEMVERLKRIEDQISAKAHPMQDFSTLKIALLDVIEVLKGILEEEKCSR